MSTPPPPPSLAISPEHVYRRLERIEQMIVTLQINVEQLANATPREETAKETRTAIPTDSRELSLAHAELEEVRTNVVKLQEELDGKISDIERYDREAAAAGEKWSQLKNACAGLHYDIEAAREEKQRIEAATEAARTQFAELERGRAEAQRVILEAGTAGERLAEAQRSRSEAEQALALLHEKEQEYAAYREGHEMAQRLVTRIWPAWMLTPEFANWRSQLEGGLFAVESPASLSLLFAALHSYRAALREAGDARVLLDSLRELSRRLLTWLKERGQGEEEAVSHSQQWATAINRECEGKAEVEVPVPGNPADTAWMIFPTRTGASDIVSVQSWCVRDGQKRPINKAQVTV